MLSLPSNIRHGKPCRKCGGIERYVADGKCVSCKRAYWRGLGHPRNDLHRKLGITKERYYQILESQDWSCAICRRAKRLDVDHDHATGKFRGMLCKGCNTALGKFQDSAEMLLRAVAYLRGTL